MKKYLSGIIAVIIAVSLVAFTMPEKSSNAFDNATFYYQSSTYSNGEVAKKENWSSTATAPTCAGTQNKACKLVIDAAQTTLTGGVRHLNNDISVMPGAGGSTSGFVPNPSTPGYVSRNDKP